MICTFCESLNQDGFKFCIKCGKPLIVQPSSQSISGNTPDPVDMKFQNAGAPLPWFIRQPFRRILVIIGFLSVFFSLIFFAKDFFYSDKKSTLNITPSPTSYEPAYISSTPTSIKTTDRTKYEIDSNGDAIPDFVEEALGWKPTINPCIKDACGEAYSETLLKKAINVVFVLDSSGSMAEKLSDGRSRMEVAKTVLKDYVSLLPSDINAALVVYGHKGSNSLNDKPLSCSTIETLYPLSPISLNNFSQAVDNFQPTGWTPISNSLQHVASTIFSGHEGEDNFIILISDGEETCGGNPCQTAMELNKQKIHTTINVVGLGVNQTTKNQLSCIADNAEGKYYDATSYEELRDALKDSTQRLDNIMAVGRCVSKNTTTYQKCIYNRWKQADGYVKDEIKKLQSTRDSQDPEVKTLRNLTIEMARGYLDIIRESVDKWRELKDENLNNLRQELDNWK